MPKKTRSRSNPADIFNTAESYLQSATVLRKSIRLRTLPDGTAPDDISQRVGMPGNVLEAFSLELYFKSLLTQRSPSKSFSGHNLWELYKKLSNEDKDGIQFQFENAGEAEMRARALYEEFFERQQSKMDLSIEGLLKISFDAFTKLRYPHEGLLDTGWMALDVVYATRNHILEQFPEWEIAGVTEIVNRE